MSVPVREGCGNGYSPHHLHVPAEHLERKVAYMPSRLHVVTIQLGETTKAAPAGTRGNQYFSTISG